jgi:hypothetical protein
VNVLDSLGCEVGSYTSTRPWAFVDPWGLQALYFSANGDDPRFEAEHELVAQECERIGVAFCIWLNVPRQQAGGVQFAQHASAAVTHYGGAARVKAVLFDNEKVPLAFQAGYIDQWDGLRPWRDTLFSVEPYQDRTQNDYARMLRRNAVSVPTLGRRVRKVTFQCYRGGMQPEPPRAVRDYLGSLVPDVDGCPTVDPAQAAHWLTQIAATGSTGACLFESGRFPS